MKKLMLAFALCWGMMSLTFAQTWEKPLPPAEDLSSLASGTTVYVYNVDADAFIINGMTSNTQACATRPTNGDLKVTVPQQFNAYVSDGKVKMKQLDYNKAYVSCPNDTKYNVLIKSGTDTNSEFTYAAIDGSTVYTLTNAALGKALDVSWEYGGHLTLTDGAGKTQWAFIKETNVTNGAFALYKSKKQMYNVYMALVEAGKADDHKDALDEAYSVYSYGRATAETVTEASRKLFNKVFVDINSPVNVSFLLENADMAGSQSTKGWGNHSPGLGWGELEIYHASFTLSQDAEVPLGKYDLGFHSLYREDGSGSAPVLTAKTSKGSYTGKTPLMGTLDYAVTNTTSNNWSTNNSRIQPNGMQSCAQGLTHTDAMAWAKNIEVGSSGELAITYKVSTTAQWVNFQGMELIYKGTDSKELASSLKAAISEATTLYGSGSGNGASDLKAVIDKANEVYAKSDATNKEIKESIDALATAMKNYRYSNASESNPIDKTSLIVNADFENGTEGWTISGFTTQGNSAFKKKHGATYLEKWTGRGGKVGDGKAIQNVVGLDMGVYKLVAAAQNIQEDTPNNSQSGAWIVANGSSVKVDKTDDYTLIFTNIESEATIGYKCEGATGNWISTDNFRLYYIGNEADFKAEMQKYVDNAKAYASSKMHNAAKEELDRTIAAAEAELAKEGTGGYINVSTPLRKATEEAEVSAKAYAALLAAIEKAEAKYATNGSQNLLDAINTAKILYADGETSYDDMTSIANFLESASNNPNLVYQVTSAVSLTEKVDFRIAGITPFATAGSVDIVNPDAVVIIENIKPSLVLARHMSHIFINGEQAKNNVNCQVRMYNTGAIIFPYGNDFKPLTVYSEQNFGGTAVNDFGLENSNGYMNTLTAEKLNNAIRSFKLKRGYMVTFALGERGRGYSRCFIADHADLEFATLPDVLDKHITSYRVFKWNNAQKKGLASDTGAEGNQVLNSSWCYDWGPGQDRGVDTETVPHKIHKSWPAVADCGRVTYSPHMKTDNEPGNSADDQPGTVAEVLAYWEDAMATGMRLCSPSSHDGSLQWLRDFMKEIDARGWRCDILDMHCYWPSGSFPGLQNWYNDYKRPIWISEFVWGASWNNNGVFGDSDRSFSLAAQQRNYDGMRPILESLNSMAYVERYAYWNSEADCSKIYKYGTGLSLLGEFYAEMNSGLGYNEKYQYVPKVVCKAPSGLTASIPPASKMVTLTWNHPNGELSKYAVVERMVANEDNNFVAIKTIYDVESTTMTVKDTLTDKTGTVYYRIKNYDCDGRTRTSNEAFVTIVSASGTDFIKYGTLAISDLDGVPVEFNAPYEEVPAVFTGIYTNHNAEAIPTTLISEVTKSGFSYKLFPLQYQDDKVSFTKVEEVPFIALPVGNHTFEGMDIEVGKTVVTGDTVNVTFNKAFPEGVTPVVISDLNPTDLSLPYYHKVWDVTNTGFKAVAFHEEGAGKKVAEAQPFQYAAFTPGKVCIDAEENLYFSAGIASTKVYGLSARLIEFTQNIYDDAGNITYIDTLMLKEPLMFGATQTNAYNGGVVLRQTATTTETIDGEKYITGIRVRKLVDDGKSGIKNNANTADIFGWVVLSKGGTSSKEVGIGNVYGASGVTVEVADRRIIVNGADNYEIYNIKGMKTASDAVQEPGVYLVRAGKSIIKVVVR